jgi:Xaa-Pro aminopeptidase
MDMKRNRTPGISTLQRAMVAAFAFLCLSGASFGQYTDTQAINDLGGPKEFARRRMELAKKAKTGYVLLFANTHLPEAAHYREDNDFYYFTGVADPGSVLLIDAEKGTSMLFEPQQEKRTAQVYGPNLLSLPKEEQARMGFPAIFPVTQLEPYLVYFLGMKADADLWVRLGAPDKADGARIEVAEDYAERDKSPWHPPLYESEAPAHWLSQKFPGAQLKDITPLIDAMRNIKTAEEIEVLRRNGKLSAEGDREAIAHAHPGMYQYQIEAAAYNYFYSHGAQGMAYPAIVGSGTDINTWHYFSNRHRIQDNELVVFDYAASLDQLTMDITRTFDISGKFTPEQAKWYAVDLDTQKAVIAMLTPGHTYEEADAAG